MSELWLIAHKVRGEPAFDVATRMECPECCNGVVLYKGEVIECAECEGTARWWIIPTSGHRAYPASAIPMNELYHSLNELSPGPVTELPLPIMDNLPDHYTTHAEPKIDIRALIPKKKIVINRRG